MRQQSLFDSIPAPLPPVEIPLTKRLALRIEAMPGVIISKPSDDPYHAVSHTAAEFNEFERDYRARISESNRRWALSS